LIELEINNFHKANDTSSIVDEESKVRDSMSFDMDAPD